MNHQPTPSAEYMSNLPVRNLTVSFPHNPHNLGYYCFLRRPAATVDASRLFVFFSFRRLSPELAPKLLFGLRPTTLLGRVIFLPAEGRLMEWASLVLVMLVDMRPTAKLPLESLAGCGLRTALLPGTMVDALVGDLPPELRTGDLPPELRTGDLPPELRTGDLPPELRTGDFPPELRTGDLPELRTGDLPPELRPRGGAGDMLDLTVDNFTQG